MTDRIIYGRNPVREALRADPERILQVYALRDLDREGRKLLANLRSSKVSVQSYEKSAMGQLCKVRQHQGIAARVLELKNASLNRIHAQKPSGLRVLVLSSVQDPGNLGAVLRSAEHFGLDLFIVGSKESCSIQLGSVAKSSAGAVEHIPILSSANLPKVLEELKEKDFRIFGLEAEASENLIGTSSSPQENLCLVVGSEGFGIKSNLQKYLDGTLYIPRFGKMESLNISAASLMGILFMKGMLNAESSTG